MAVRSELGYSASKASIAGSAAMYGAPFPGGFAYKNNQRGARLGHGRRLHRGPGLQSRSKAAYAYPTTMKGDVCALRSRS